MAKQKRVTVKADTTFKYLQLLNGIIKLTDTEMSVLADFIDRYKKARQAGINTDPFSSDSKKAIAEKQNRDNFNTLNYYIQKLKNKGAIIPTDNGYRIRGILIPGDETEIVFVLDKNE